MSNLRLNQGDQMATLFVQFLAVYNALNWPKMQCFAKVGTHFCLTINKPAKIDKDLKIFVKSVQTWPNRVTLDQSTLEIE